MGKYTVKHGLLLLLALTLSPCVAASEPACIAYAYTTDSSEGHLSLITSNSYVFGTKVTVISNCENNQLIIDNQLIAYSNNSIEAFSNPGLHSITISSGNFTANYTNVTFIEQGQLSQIIRDLPAEHNPYSQPYTIEEIDSIELWSGVGAILVSWLIVTGFLWKIIKAHSDKTHCVEVS